MKALPPYEISLQVSLFGFDKKGSPRALGAFLASLALHGGCIWVFPRNEPSPILVTVQPSQLAWVEVESIPAPVAPTPALVAEPLKPSKPPRSKPVAVAQKPGPSLEPADTPPRASDVPMASSDVPRRSVNLTLSVDALQRLDAGLSDEQMQAQLEPTSAARLDDLTRDEFARAKVQRGQVHPYFAQLGKSLLKQWDADRIIAKGSLRSFAEQAGQNMQIYNELWAARAQQFGATGSPLDEGAAKGGRIAPSADRVAGLSTVDLEGRKELQRELSKQFKARRQALIEVTQDRSGKLLSAKLLSPSLDANVDREAVADVKAAAEKLPAPPLEVLGNAQRVVSVWNFELIVSITPPVPTFTFEFDEVAGVIDARLPLDRRIYKKVRLVSVKQVE